MNRKANRLLLSCAYAFVFASCDSKAVSEAGETKPVSTNSWYSSWISEYEGEQFHSELSLAPGEVESVSIPSETPLVVGYIVEKGYEVSKDSGTIYMGTNDTPHAVAGSPGTWKEFEASNGVVTIRIENKSTIATRIAIYTKSES